MKRFYKILFAIVALCSFSSLAQAEILRLCANRATGALRIAIACSRAEFGLAIYLHCKALWGRAGHREALGQWDQRVQVEHREFKGQLGHAVRRGRLVRRVQCCECSMRMNKRWVPQRALNAIILSQVWQTLIDPRLRS